MRYLRLIIAALCLALGMGATLPASAESNLGGAVEYTVFYELNGGTNGPDTATILGNEKYSVLKVNDLTPIKDGFSFSGWALDSAREKVITPGAYITLTNRVTTLYAVWAPIAEVPTVSDVKTEPLGEFYGTVASRSDGHMFSTPALIALIIGVPIIVAMMIGGGVLIYRTIKQ